MRFTPWLPRCVRWRIRKTHMFPANPNQQHPHCHMVWENASAGFQIEQLLRPKSNLWLCRRLSAQVATIKRTKSHWMILAKLDGWNQKTLGGGYKHGRLRKCICSGKKIRCFEINCHINFRNFPIPGKQFQSNPGWSIATNKFDRSKFPLSPQTSQESHVWERSSRASAALNLILDTSRAKSDVGSECFSSSSGVADSIQATLGKGRTELVRTFRASKYARTYPLPCGLLILPVKDWWVIPKPKRSIMQSFATSGLGLHTPTLHQLKLTKLTRKPTKMQRGTLQPSLHWMERQSCSKSMPLEVWWHPQDTSPPQQFGSNRCKACRSWHLRW